MAVSEVSIANMALSRVGSANKITALSDNTEEARQCNLHYEQVRDSLLRSHPWNFATTRTKLITSAESALVITGATAANPVVITSAAHGYTTGNRVRIASIVGMTELNGREFTVTLLTANTFSLNDENGTGYTAYSSAGTVTKIPAFEFSYWFTLPPDCMRVINVNDGDARYKVEKGRLLFEDDEAELLHVAKITDPTLFDASFVRALVMALAVEISVKLSDNANLKESLKVDLRDMMGEARGIDAQDGGTADGLEANTWIMARF